VELQPGRRLVVIGAGFIGAEAASTASALGLDVTIVEAMATPLAGPLGLEMGQVVSSLHADHGVRLLCGTGVRRLTGVGRVDGVELEDGRVLQADLVLVGVGAQPNVEWLRGSGLGLGNGVLCDAGGLTTVPGVVAVGDCAAWYDGRLGRPHRVEHWTGALDRPKRAVATLLSGDSTGPDVVPAYFWSDQYDVRIQFAGHAASADTVSVEDGDPADRSFLAVYRRGDEPVAVLGMNQPRAFTRWRRSLATAPVTATS
jgi:NADPH-dependent 2,4-dienoyl-CoA reductase/sulfur reductase-like enzyme